MSQLAFKTLLNSYWSNRGDGKYSWNLNYLTGRAGSELCVCLSVFLCRFLLLRYAGEDWKIGCSLWISLQKPMWHPRKAGIGYSSSPAGQPRCRRHFKSLLSGPLRFCSFLLGAGFLRLTGVCLRWEACTEIRLGCPLHLLTYSLYM